MFTYLGKFFWEVPLIITKTAKAITFSAYHLLTSMQKFYNLLNANLVPLNSRLPVFKNPRIHLLPKLSVCRMAPGPAAPTFGPLHARLMSDDTFYRQADLEEKVSIEKGIVEEMMQIYFASGGGRIVHQGPLPAAPGATPAVAEEHTALWHVLHPEKDTISVVYMYAHLDMDRDQAMVYLRDALGEEMKVAEKEGKLVEGKPFGIVQAGLAMSFFEYHGELVPVGIMF